MNVKRFTARTAREALALLKQALGDDAVVLSTKPCAEGVEILALAPDGMAQIERMSAELPAQAAALVAASPMPAWAADPAPAPATATSDGPAKALSKLARSVVAHAKGPLVRTEPTLSPGDVLQDVAKDVEQLAMSTLSFQGYVRERMLKRREAALRGNEAPAAPVAAPEPTPALPQNVVSLNAAARDSGQPSGALQERLAQRQARGIAAQLDAARPTPAPWAPERAKAAPVLREEVRDDLRKEMRQAPRQAERAAPSMTLAETHARRDQQDMMAELRQVKGLIEERFGALAFMEKLQRHPVQARLSQRMLDCGFSPALIRKLVEGMSAEITDEMDWAGAVLERNLLTAEQQPALEDQGGVFAMVGSTGVGKTTSTAKLAAAFATKHGAANLGLITLDAYRVGAHEQLRAYGRILGVPVHTAHDRASLEDLLELLAGKHMVLIDTAGMGQRDTRTRELLEMVGHASIRKLLVVNASAQGETIEDVLTAYRAVDAHGIILSKVDEAVKLGPALDAMIRHRLRVLAVANGQRVPEDWHRLSGQALMHRALRAHVAPAFRMDNNDVNLIFAAQTVNPVAAAAPDGNA
ncbi:MAG: hypothetical protein RJA98_2732 [Pseudomonadota bacterium]|jgi:flagellar biosynthesis protein FlhF